MSTPCPKESNQLQELTNKHPTTNDLDQAKSRPFQSTGVDFAGHLYVRFPDASGSSKTWLCLYTCSTTRAVHLDLVTDLTATTFLRSFRRFIARCGTPSRMVSDNGKTFKSAATILSKTLESCEVSCFCSKRHIEWYFNLERGGGILSA